MSNQTQLEPIDADILELSIEELRQLYMQNRSKARIGIKTLEATGDDHCWIDLIDALISFVPVEERKNFTIGNFNMIKNRILYGCHKFIDFEISQGRVLPDKERAIS